MRGESFCLEIYRKGSYRGASGGGRIRLGEKRIKKSPIVQDKIAARAKRRRTKKKGRGVKKEAAKRGTSRKMKTSAKGRNLRRARRKLRRRGESRDDESSRRNSHSSEEHLLDAEGDHGRARGKKNGRQRKICSNLLIVGGIPIS